MLTEGEWCDPIRKKSHHRKNSRKKGLDRTKRELGTRGLGVSGHFDPTARPVPYSSIFNDSGGVPDVVP